jgi:hypothetical protein
VDVVTTVLTPDTWRRHLSGNAGVAYVPLGSFGRWTWARDPDGDIYRRQHDDAPWTFFCHGRAFGETAAGRYFAGIG